MSASAEPATAVFDLPEAARSLALLHPAGHTFEVRVPNARNVRYNGRPDPRTGTAFGFFDSGEGALSALPALEEAEWPGLYVTLNAVTPALLARASNRIKAADRKSSSTSDHDVKRRTALLIDGDPVRPADISATNEEHEGALERIAEIRWFLSELGWPGPITADSGNGGHLVYRVELPAEDGGLVKDFLNALADAFDDDHVHVDRTVFNAARIVKLWGTVARKGDSTADRPHRMSKVLDVPVERGLVTEAMLREAAVALRAGREEKPTTPTASTAARVGSFDVRDFIARHFPDADERTWSSGTRWILDPCPFNADHKGTSAAILQSTSGVLSFKCQHDGCAGLVWRDLREKYEPKATRPATATASQPAAPAAERKDTGEAKQTVSIFEALQEIVAVPEWTVEGLQDPCGIGILASDAYHGKTALEIGLGLHEAAGKDFLGFKIPAAVPVLYLPAEGSREKFKLRAKVIASCYGIELNGLPFEIHKKTLTRFPHFNTPDFRKLVVESGKKVVFCDTSRFFTKGDENSSTDFMNLIVQPLKELGAELGIFFWLTTHYGKPNENRSGSQRVRGTSAQKGDVDVLTRLEAPNGTRAPERIWIFDKVKDAAEPPDMSLIFQPDRGVFARAEGQPVPLSNPKASRAEARQAAKDEGERKAREGIGLLIRRSDDGITAKELGKASGRRQEWVADVLNELHAQKQIRLVPAQRLDSMKRKITVQVWKWETT